MGIGKTRVFHRVEQLLCKRRGSSSNDTSAMLVMNRGSDQVGKYAKSNESQFCHCQRGCSLQVLERIRMNPMVLDWN